MINELIQNRLQVKEGIELHRRMRDFPRFNRSMNVAYDTKLTPAEAHFILELGSVNELYCSEASALLAPPIVTASDINKSLLRKGLTSAQASLTDGRHKRLKLTVAGIKCLKSINQQSEALLTAFTKQANMSASEISVFASLLTKLCDALGAPITNRQSKESPLRPPIRRLTRDFGLLGQNVFGAGLNTLQWQTLLLVAQSSLPLNINSLADLSQAPMSSLSQTVALLSHRKLLKKMRKTAASDGRLSQVTVSSSGRALIRRLEQAEGMRLASAMTNWSIRLREQLFSLCSRFMNGAALHHALTQQGYSIEEVNSHSQRKELRRLLLRQWMQEPPKDIPESLYSSRNLCFALMRNRAIIGGCELLPTQQGFEPVNLIYETNKPSAARALELWLQLRAGQIGSMARSEP